MKKIYFAVLFFCILTISATAQSDTSEISYSDSIHITFTEWRDSIFEQLDKTPITSVYLAENLLY